MAQRKQKNNYIPNKARATVSGNYAVIIAGKRYVLPHYSGELLKGKVL